MQPKRKVVEERVTSSPEERLALFHTRRLLRIAFYTGLNRRVPSDIRSLPSYVRGVQRKYQLASRNQARQMLAEVEGFDSWHEVMRVMLSDE